jgi:hypothetical protein
MRVSGYSASRPFGSAPFAGPRCHLVKTRLLRGGADEMGSTRRLNASSVPHSHAFFIADA